MRFLRKFVPEIHFPPLQKNISLIGKRFLNFGIKRYIKPRSKYTQHYKIAVGGFSSAYKMFGLMNDRINGVLLRLSSFAEIGHAVKMAVKEKR